MSPRIYFFPDDTCGRLSSFSNLKMRTNNKRKVITSSCNETPNVSSTKPHNSSAVTTSRGNEDKNSRVKHVCHKETNRLKQNVTYKKKLKCTRKNYMILIVIQVKFTICNLSSFIWHNFGIYSIKQWRWWWGNGCRHDQTKPCG